MKAVVCTAYGPPDVLQLQEVPDPSPAVGEVRLRVHSTTAHVGDARIRAFRVPRFAWIPARIALGLFRPRRSILGMDAAGTVDSVGEQVTGFEPGDRVVAFTGFRFGGNAELVCVTEAGKPRKTGMLAKLPDSVSFEQAAPLAAGGVTALLVLRKAAIEPGQRVLVYGASGSVGTYAVQLAKHHFGARVTAVCGARNLDLARSLGADVVFDYAADDWSQDGPVYDVVFDAVSRADKTRAKSCLKPGGTLLDVDPSSEGLKLSPADLELLVSLVAGGSLRSVVDRRWPLEQIVEAHRYVDTRRKVGNVLIDVASGGAA